VVQDEGPEFMPQYCKTNKQKNPTKNPKQQQQKKPQHGIGTKTDMKTSGTEDTDMNSRRYAHQIFDKGTQNIRWRKRQPL
jgi:ABC-type uncharacterized transport system involved in gliding motility auxiliary subunit